MDHLGRFFRTTYQNPTAPTVLMALFLLIGMVSVLVQFLMALFTAIANFPQLGLVIAVAIAVPLTAARMRRL